MADDDVPVTRPDLPFEPLDIEDGPTLEIYVPDDSLSTRRFRTITSSDFARTIPKAKRAPVPLAEELDETLTLRRDADPETMRLPRSSPSFDDLTTTPLGAASERTGPFLLVAPPLPSTPFPLVPRATPQAPQATHPHPMPAQPPLLAAPVLPPQSNALPPPPPRPGFAASQTRLVLVFASGVLGTIAVALVIAVLVVTLRPRSSSRAATSFPTPGATAGAGALPRASGAAGAVHCRVERRPQRIASSVVPSAPAMIAPALNPDELAVGLADSRNSALGVVVDLTDLSVERRYAESFTRPVFRVTPHESAGSLRFAIDHDDPRLQSARTIVGPPALLVGVNYFGFVLATPGRDPQTLWPGGKGESISEPVFASVSGVGHAVAFSRGRLGGSLHVGWLSRQGEPKSDLATLERNVHEIGSPAIAAGESGLLVAVAVRDAQRAPWRIVLASAEPGKLPTATTSMTTGAGPDRTMPSVTALDSGWLVTWIETASDGRRVRAQVLNEQLRGVEPPFDVASSSGIEDARGALHRAGSRVLSLFVTRRERYELWASAIDCRVNG